MEGTTIIPPSYNRVRAARDRQTDTQTAVLNIHFASAAPHAKCNEVPYSQFTDITMRQSVHQPAQPVRNFNTTMACCNVNYFVQHTLNYYYYYYIRLTAFSRTTWVSRHQKNKPF